MKLRDISDRTKTPPLYELLNRQKVILKTFKNLEEMPVTNLNKAELKDSAR